MKHGSYFHLVIVNHGDRFRPKDRGWIGPRNQIGLTSSWRFLNGGPILVLSVQVLAPPIPLSGGNHAANILVVGPVNQSQA